jgi:hypothetical protein
MRKPLVGALVGGGLGVLDGLSAWFSPEARTMMVAIVVGSTIKGLVTGLLCGYVARRWRSLWLGISAGLLTGLVLSTFAAMGQPDHYWEIVLPGMLLGAIVGFVTQRYPPTPSRVSSSKQAAAGLLVLTCLPITAALAQPAPAADPLADVAVLVGRWSGTTEGQPGKGTVEREYARVLGSRFIEVKNRSSYPPTAKIPKGEIHEDLGIFSFDKARKAIIFRQFHVEGFVNQYARAADGKPGTVTFVSEAIENIPAGWRARETYVIAGPDAFEEIFELAAPGKDFELYSRTRLTRVK